VVVGHAPRSDRPTISEFDRRVSPLWPLSACSCLPGVSPSSTPLSANRRQHLSSRTPAPTNVPRFVFISLDILFQVSLADCFIVSDSFYDTDCPRAHRLSETLSFLDRRPYSLIMADRRYYSLVIVFPSSTLRVFQFSDLFLTRFRFRVPLTIKPLIDARSCFMTSF